MPADSSHPSQSDHAIRDTDDGFGLLFELSPDLLCVANFEGWLEQVNPAWTDCLGWSAEELTSRPMDDFIEAGDLEATSRTRKAIQAGVTVRGFENRYRCKDGSFRWLSWNARPARDKGGIFAVARDITEFKQAQLDILAIQNALPGHVALLDAAGVIVSVNESWRRFGRNNGMDCEETCVGADYLKVCGSAIGQGADEARRAAAGIGRVLERSQPDFEMEYPCPTVNGLMWFRLMVAPLREGQPNGAVVMHIDITAQKRAEEKIHRLNRLYAVSSGINEAIVRIRDTVELYERACRIVVERGGLRMAWVGLEKDGELVPAAHWGDGEEYLNQLRLTTGADQVSGRGPAGRAYRSGRPVGCNDIENDTETFAFRKEALRGGYRSCAVFPLVVEGKPMGVLAVYADQPGYFEEGEIHLFNSLAENLSFAVESHQRERDRRRAETSLRESERRFRQLAEHSSEVVWIKNLEQIELLYVSPAYEKIWGRSCESLYLAPTSWRDAVHPDDRERVARAAKTAPASRYDVVYRIVRPDGAERWIHDRANPVRNADGHIYRMAGTASDITERMLAQEKLREQATLLDKAQDAIVVRDLDHRILYWNQSAARLYGWSSKEAVGNSVRELIYRDLPQFDRATNAVLRAGEWVGEMHQCTRAGKNVIVEGRWTLVPDSDGRPRSILCINTDITRRKQLEQQFLRAQRMESIGTLAGGIAHDLNNVLAPILMSIDLLKASVSGKRGLEILTMVEASARRGADMVGQVLSFARGMEGRRIRVRPADVFADLLKITGEAFRKNIRVTAKIPPDVWPLDADPTQLHQVLLNLCMNARDVLPTGGTISLAAANVAIGSKFAAMNLEARVGRYVRFEVADDGTGIDPEVLESIFDPFFTTKEVGKGTGLGLPTAMAIIRGHAGFIKVLSKPGLGTRFRFYLPAAEGPAPAEEIHGTPTAADGRLILLADDEPSIREITGRALEDHGYRVRTAAGGAEALAIFSVDPQAFDAVITDMMMPGMAGPALVAELRKIRPAVPIVGMSGVSGSARKFRVSVEKFLPKPYSAEALLTALGEIFTE